ncbi:MAG TPA: cytochrome P450 [Acetobacteraceae bacterium]|nr:cytochrome P450 [Acetobacteraceae bacterium]
MDAAHPNVFIPPHPPVPATELPFLQFLRAIRTNALTMWTERAYEEDVLVRRFLGRSHILLNAPDAIHHVLVDNPANYRRSPASIRILRPITGNGLLLSEGDDWRLQRRTIAPSLAPRTLPVLARHIVTCTQDALAALAGQVNQPINLLAAMQSLALEIAGRSMFSLETRQHGAEMRSMLTEYARNYSKPHLFDMVLPPSVPTLRDLGRRRFQRRWMRLIEEIMQTRLAAPAAETPRDLFDLLRAARDPETGEGFSRDHLRDQVATMILAGHETTAVTLFWSLVLLAGAPAEQQRVAEEARGLVIEPEDAMAVMPQLVRSRAVVSEALRLYPPAFALAREAIAADRINDVDVPRGTVILIAPWVLHRHRRLWRDPDAFDPSRFLPGAPAVPRFAYLPFGAGPRVCVGAQFALSEATLVLAMLVREFAVTLEDPASLVPVAVVTTQPNRPPTFTLRRR